MSATRGNVTTPEEGQHAMARPDRVLCAAVLVLGLGALSSAYREPGVGGEQGSAGYPGMETHP